jgi:hypothetical protein
MEKNKTKGSDGPLAVELLVKLPEKTRLNTQETVVICVKNMSLQTVTGLHIKPGNLMITTIVEERETSKSIEEVDQFTLEEFNAQPRGLKSQHALLISAKLTIMTLDTDAQKASLVVQYEMDDPLTNDKERLELKIQALR